MLCHKESRKLLDMVKSEGKISLQRYAQEQLRVSRGYIVYLPPDPVGDEFYSLANFQAQGTVILPIILEEEKSRFETVYRMTVSEFARLISNNPWKYRPVLTANPSNYERHREFYDEIIEACVWLDGTLPPFLEKRITTFLHSYTAQILPEGSKFRQELDKTNIRTETENLAKHFPEEWTKLGREIGATQESLHDYARAYLVQLRSFGLFTAARLALSHKHLPNVYNTLALYDMYLCTPLALGLGGNPNFGARDARNMAFLPSGQKDGEDLSLFKKSPARATFAFKDEHRSRVLVSNRNSPEIIQKGTDAAEKNKEVSSELALLNQAFWDGDAERASGSFNRYTVASRKFAEELAEKDAAGKFIEATPVASSLLLGWTGKEFVKHLLSAGAVPFLEIAAEIAFHAGGHKIGSRIEKWAQKNRTSKIDLLWDPSKWPFKEKGLTYQFWIGEWG